MGLLQPLQLRSGQNRHKVTWLELFFDLVFVAAVSQVAEPLRHHYAIGEVARFTPLFVLIWWAWTGHTLFSTRFTSDDAVQRTLTLVQMFVVAAMAANAQDALDSRSSAGFAAAYAVVRVLLVVQYVRARRLPETRALTTRYIVGHGAAAVLWLASAFTPAPERYWVWAAAFALDLGTPWLAVPHSARVPPDPAHLPERFGLFTIILLGESVVAVMHGMESQEHWSPAAATSAFLGMAVCFLGWWWYFDGVQGGAERPVRTHRDAIRHHVWSYAHVPLYLGIVIASAGVQELVTAVGRHDLSAPEARLLFSAAALVMAGMTVIGAASAPPHRYGPSKIAGGLGLAALTIAIGASATTSPVVLMVALFLLCVGQALVAAARPVPPRPRIPYAAAVRTEN